MVKQIGLGTILGAIVLFVWSAIAWMVIPWPGQPVRGFTNEEAMTQAITTNAPRSGNYFLPFMPQRTPGMTDEQYNKAVADSESRMTRGPVVFAAVRLEPFGGMGKPLAFQFLTQLIVALTATILLMQTSGLSYACRVGFVAACGVLIFVGGHFDEWNWFSFSNAYMLMQGGAIVIGWCLAAFVIAAFAKGKGASKEAYG